MGHHIAFPSCLDLFLAMATMQDLYRVTFRYRQYVAQDLLILVFNIRGPQT